MSNFSFKNAQKRTFLVTGANSFVGRAIIDAILSTGAKVIAADSSPIDCKDANLTAWQVDLTSDYKSLPEGVTDLIHTADKAGDWGDYKDFYAFNVAATQKLLRLARFVGVKNFLFVSSIDIHGFFGHNGSKEDGIYYSSKCFYPMTKTLAEKEVRNANEKSMKTVCVRPCFVYGPNDATECYPIMDAIAKGRTRLINKGGHLISRIYITDLVQGVCLALENGIGGEAYNLTSGEKISAREWTTAIAEKLNAKTPKKSIPYALAFGLGGMLEWLYKLFRAKTAPSLTRRLVQHTGHDFYFVPDKAKAELGFRIEVAWQDGVEAMVADYKAQKSKADAKVKKRDRRARVTNA